MGPEIRVGIFAHDTELRAWLADELALISPTVEVKVAASVDELADGPAALWLVGTEALTPAEAEGVRALVSGRPRAGPSPGPRHNAISGHTAGSEHTGSGHTTGSEHTTGSATGPGPSAGRGTSFRPGTGLRPETGPGLGSGPRPGTGRGAGACPVIAIGALPTPLADAPFACVLDAKLTSKQLKRAVRDALTGATMP